jgi:TRAP-type C4-dicarboxylate transport system substrate-binding protein
MVRRLVVVLAALALVLGTTVTVAIVTEGTARADGTTLKVGTLAPAESPWGQVFKIWAKAVNDRTSGSLQLQFFWNGQQGDEGAMVGKMRTGQLDGAAITATGLSMIYKDVLVLQLPGLFRDWGKLDHAREALKPGFDAAFDKQGFKILGWGDVGMAHLMTKGFEVHVPADLKHKNCFFIAGDPIESKFYQMVGDVTAKQVSVPEILTGLTAGTINVVNAPALAAEQLQWASRLDHINSLASGAGIGALVFASAKIKSLPADAQQVLVDTGKVAGDALTGRIRREDDAALGRLKARMATYEPNAAEQQQWEQIFSQTRAALRGNTIDAKVFDDAVRYAQQ